MRGGEVPPISRSTLLFCSVAMVAACSASTRALSGHEADEPSAVCERSAEIVIAPSAWDGTTRWDVDGPDSAEDPAIAEQGATHSHVYGRDVGRFSYHFELPDVRICGVALSARLSSEFAGFSGPADGFSDVEVGLGSRIAPLRRVIPDNGSGKTYTWRFGPSAVFRGRVNAVEFRVPPDAPYRHGLCVYGKALAAGQEDGAIRITYTYR